MPDILSLAGRMANKLKRYGELVMFSHILFSLTFACVAAVWAGGGNIYRWFWIFAAIFGMRNASNAFNRVVDREYDAENPRTMSRILPRGDLKISEAKWISAAGFGLYFLSAFMLSPLCAALSPAPFILCAGYSYTKRVTPLCHFVLGAAVACAPMGAWIALTDSVSWAPLLLSGAVMFWTAGFDIIYATEDIDFDRKKHLKSLPASFGFCPSMAVSGCAFWASSCMMALAGISAGAGAVYFLGVVISAAIMAAELVLSAKKSKTLNFRVYSLNKMLGVCYFALAMTDYFIVKL